MHLFVFRETQEMWDLQLRQQEGSGSRRGAWGQQERVEERLQCLSLGWRVFYLRPLRLPEIINMCCHSCFSSSDFIQSL